MGYRISVNSRERAAMGGMGGNGGTIAAFAAYCRRCVDFLR